ncbi:MAG: HPF/RaiA family ribosome-associated protein [Saprospiraceae bacterium]
MVSRIQSIHFDADLKLLSFIESKLNTLDHYIAGFAVSSMDVILKLENSGKLKEKVVELNLTLAGLPIAIRSKAKKFEDAFRKAYQQLKRAVIRYKDKLQSKH